MTSKKVILLLTLLTGLYVFTLVRTATASQIEPCHFETGDQYGAKKGTFYQGENVYINGSGFPPNTKVDIYVVNDTTWIEGMNIPTNGIVTKNVCTMNSGELPLTMVWKAPLTSGKYDIVVDVNQNRKYDNGDCLEDNEVNVTAGFLVIPEYIYGTILGTTGCIAAFGAYRLFKPKNKVK